ncbi:MAG TPA: type II toxin-antitoxin system Phd/YefM family antitoxin [Acidobacteriaceae bacterium]
MKLSTQIKPISYIKSHAAEVLDQLHEEREPIVITQNGEARAVLMDVKSYEQSQETLAMLRILAIGEQQVQEGKAVPLAEAAADLRAKLAGKRR